MILPPEEIYYHCLQAGFSPDQAVTMTAIALAESGGDTEAHNPNNEDSIGLWQINRSPDAHPQYLALDGTDPAVNARMAFEVSGGGTNIRPWTVTHGDKGSPYLQHRAAAEDAAAANGYPDAEGQWDPPWNYSSAAVAAGEPAEGPFPSALEGTIGTGTTDEVVATQTEVAATQPAAEQPEPPGPDRDADGLLDAYEANRGLDPSAVDTDRDGFTDGVEAAHGTDPVAYRSNPLVAPSDEAPSFRPGLTTEDPPAPPPANPGVSGLPHQPVPGGQPAPVTPAPDASVGVGSDQGPNLPGYQARSEAGQPGEQVEPGPLDTFLDAALSQDGAEYIFGAEVDPGDADPLASGEEFDCSELVEWAAARAGATVPDGSYNQYLHLRDQGTELTVEEALGTPGALLFNFSTEPVAGGGRPSTAHVAISLGDGRTIEARGSAYGVGQFDTEGREFSHAAYIGELGTELTPSMAAIDGSVIADPLPAFGDTDADGLLDAYEQMISTDPFQVDADMDGFLDSIEVAYGHDPLDFADNPLLAAATDDAEAAGPDELEADDDTDAGGAGSDDAADPGLDDDLP